jgi:hypothetical protein
VSYVRHQARTYELESLQGKINMFKPTSFHGEREWEYDVEARILGIMKYF